MLNVNTGPKFSIIISTYNRAGLLPRSIQSILHQTFRDFELIIVDDGSIDHTRYIVEEFQKKDPRIRYIYQSHSGQVAIPLNVGIRASGGAYITFLASDDEWSPLYLEKQIALFEFSAGRKIDVTSCNVLMVDGDKKPLVEIPKPHYIDNDHLIKIALSRNYIFGNIIVRREMIERVGLYDEQLRIREDFDLWIRLAKAGCVFGFVYEPLYLIHRHTYGTISVAVNPEEHISITQYLLEKHKDLYDRHRAGYANTLRGLGTLSMLAGDIKNAKKYFWQTIIKKPWNPRNYINLMLSLLGRSVFVSFFEAKKKLFPFD